LLVERVWDDDLRVEVVVVERLDGIDHLPAEIVAFGPVAGRRLGTMVDHLVPDTKETRLFEEVAHPHVLVTGTPSVDVWQAVQARGDGAGPLAGRTQGPGLEDRYLPSAGRVRSRYLLTADSRIGA